MRTSSVSIFLDEHARWTHFGNGRRNSMRSTELCGIYPRETRKQVAIVGETAITTYDYLRREFAISFVCVLIIRGH